MSTAAAQRAPLAAAAALPLAGGADQEDFYGAAAWAYEALAHADPQDVALLLRLARGQRGDVVDLGCGGGRVTLPFLARGHRVLAVDESPAMLHLLRETARTLPPRMTERLRLHRSDMSRLAPVRDRFAVALLATTTVTLLDPAARARTFAWIARHLAASGVFLVDTLWFPRPAVPAPDRVAVVRDPGGQPARLTVQEEVVVGAGHRTVTLRVERWDGTLRVYRSRPRLLPEQDLADELTAAGFRVERVDLQAGPDGRARALLACRPAGGRRAR